jgi:hypothetical protein
MNPHRVEEVICHQKNPQFSMVALNELLLLIRKLFMILNNVRVLVVEVSWVVEVSVGRGG